MQVSWRAFELRPQGAPPMPPEYRNYIETVGRPRFVAAAREQYGLEINSGPFGITSRPALIGSKYADLHGQSAAYHDAVFRAYWQQAQAIDDPAVLRALAESVGLDGDDFSRALASPELDLAVNLDVAQARRLGLDSVPALVFNQKYLVSGAQPYEVLVNVVEQLSAEAADGSPQPPQQQP